MLFSILVCCYLSWHGMFILFCYSSMLQDVLVVPSAINILCTKPGNSVLNSSHTCHNFSQPKRSDTSWHCCVVTCYLLFIFIQFFSHVAPGFADYSLWIRYLGLATPHSLLCLPACYTTNTPHMVRVQGMLSSHLPSSLSRFTSNRLLWYILVTT